MIAADPAFFSSGLKGTSEHRLMGGSAPARRNGIAKAAGISEKRSGAASPPCAGKDETEKPSRPGSLRRAGA